ncbi:DUF4236 domain-containing protein [Acetivibrio mesophilus]|uniref:DUF4236 domain-containing protein n=1 Tax=Acetivibrio mesophilus TaxID=2487273 RepID=A0A4Q0I895_9FIRM|nr:DUF4236 domain-containing protein [Acetivibrio mesophilus]ODM26338.1 hypothetical protein A7W90_08965 [Clostridium sp. Bc-iso-3]RXE60603.1 DUF4236 domain-containing protein [Acetivibrio mesophilus]HHV30398.1 DUF4236 domain-containing protein [Clostridium sp.]
MGFRYRKSINLGGGFRINISKSGIGYSWGVKGYRITKTAKGTTRRTASIPGTGISYVNESGKNNGARSNKGVNPVPPRQIPEIDNNHYDTRNIVNNVANAMVSEGLEDMLAMASRAIKLNKLANIGFWVTFILGFGFPVLLLLAAAFLLLKIFIRTKGTIVLDYTIDPDQQSIVDDRMNPMIKIVECAKVWRIIQTSKVIDRKYASGASNTLNRTACKATTKAQFPFKANLQVASFKTGKETLLFLPDKLIILQGSKIGALNYTDIRISSYTTRFIESEGVPRDSQVVGQTWKYVNKSGGPDRRFKDNRQIPICLYGKLELSSTSGLNTVIMYSNPSV